VITAGVLHHRHSYLFQCGGFVSVFERILPKLH